MKQKTLVVTFVLLSVLFGLSLSGAYSEPMDGTNTDDTTSVTTFAELKTALEQGKKDISINGDIAITEAMTFDADVKVTVLQGKSLNVNNSGSLTNNGCIVYNVNSYQSMLDAQGLFYKVRDNGTADAKFTISLNNDITTVTKLNLIGSKTSAAEVNVLTIEGNNHKIVSKIESTSKYKDVLQFTDKMTATVNNLSVIGNTNESSPSGHGINIHNVSEGGITLYNVSSTDNKKSGINITSSLVSIEKVTTKDNYWGGVNVDVSTEGGIDPKLTVKGNNSFSEPLQIWTETSKDVVDFTGSSDSYEKYEWGKTIDLQEYNGSVWIKDGILTADITIGIPSSVIGFLKVPTGKTLTIDTNVNVSVEGLALASLKCEGTIINKGNISISGYLAGFTNNGSIINTGTILNNATITNSGVILNKGSITQGDFDNTGVAVNCCADKAVTGDNTLTITVNDESYGTVDIGLGDISLQNKTATVEAVATSPYYFDHWMNGTVTSYDNPITAKIEGQTLKAFFDNETVTVTFDSNGGSTPSFTTKEVTPGSKYGELPTTEWEGHGFVGWYTEATGGTKVTEDTIVTDIEDHTLYAHWTVSEITVTFDPNGGSAPSFTTKEVTPGNKYGELPTVEWEGHVFSGWYTKAEGGTKVTEDTIVATEKDHTLYAHWNAIEVTVTFDSNGGSTPSFETKTLEVGQAYGMLPTAERSGYSFIGWFTESEAGTQVTETTIVTTDEDHTLYAHWTVSEVTVTFNSAGGSDPSFATKTVEVGKEYGELPTTSKRGYDFDGWFTEREGGTQITETTIVETSEDHTLYAHWTPITITVTFDSNGGPSVSPSTKQVVFGETYGTLPTASWEYFDFIGWYTAKIGGAEITESTLVTATEDQVLYAIWGNTEKEVDHDGNKTKTETWEAKDDEGNTVIVTKEESVSTNGESTETISYSTVTDEGTNTVSTEVVKDASGNIVSTTVSETTTVSEGEKKITSVTKSTIVDSSGNIIKTTDEVVITKIDDKTVNETTKTTVEDASGTKVVEDDSTITQVSDNVTKTESTTTIKDGEGNVISSTKSSTTDTVDKTTGSDVQITEGTITYRDSTESVIVSDEFYKKSIRTAGEDTTIIDVEERITEKDPDQKVISETKTESTKTIKEGQDTVTDSKTTITYPDKEQTVIVSKTVDDKDYKASTTASKTTEGSSEPTNTAITTYNDVNQTEEGKAIITTDVVDKSLDHSKYVTRQMGMEDDSVERIVNFNSTGSAQAVADSAAIEEIKTKNLGLMVTGSDSVSVMYSSETIKGIPSSILEVYASLNDETAIAEKQKEAIGNRSFVTVDSSTGNNGDSSGNTVVKYMLNSDEIALINSVRYMGIVPAIALEDGIVVKEGLTADIDLKNGVVTISSNSKSIDDKTTYFVYIESKEPSKESSNWMIYLFILIAVILVLILVIVYLRRKNKDESA